MRQGVRTEVYGMLISKNVPIFSSCYDMLCVLMARLIAALTMWHGGAKDGAPCYLQIVEGQCMLIKLTHWCIVVTSRYEKTCRSVQVMGRIA